MQFRIVGDGDGGLIVQIHLDRFVVSESEFSKESGEIDSFFSCFRSGHDFGLARGDRETLACFLEPQLITTACE